MRRSIGLEPHHLELITYVIHAVPAGIALPTGNLGHKHDLFTRRKSGNPFANFSNDSTYFMTLNHGITGIGVQAVINMDIRTANANPFNLNQYFARLCLRARNIMKFDLTRLSHDCLLHDFSPGGF